ncbi:AfsR/SARP family transcriptional regulator [Rhizocola hellebori]|nr:BTAD domain-containing putative transcriptional regulator [Rhizocola hellebori]
MTSLVLEPGTVVPLGVLIDRVWGPALPSDATGALATYASRLRRLIAAACAEHSDAVVIHHLAGGYRLDCDPEAIDLHRARRLVRLGRQADSDELALAYLSQALDLTADLPLSGLTGSWATHVRDQLVRERLDIALERFDIELRLGRCTEIVPELLDLAAQHPLAEHVLSALMRALCAAGRPAEALDHYAQLRGRLAEELGCEPAPQLQDLFRGILRQAPELFATTTVEAAQALVPAVASPRGAWPVPAQLPIDARGFAGRHRELEQLTQLAESAAGPGLVAITGMAGIGKSALAVHWAHRIPDRFPDGQLYVNLRGFDPAGRPVEPAAAVRGFLDALGLQPGRVPADAEAQYALYRSLLAGRRMLVLLDNASDAEQVRPLLPGAGGAMVLITSRNRLTPLVATEGAHPLSLDLLSTEDSRKLLAARLGAARVAAEPDAVDTIIGDCARLPLALAIAAARAAQSDGLPLAALAADIHDTGRRLDTLDGGDPASQVRAVLSWSYATLSPPAARLFRLLGHHPGPDISAAATSSLAGCPPGQAVPLLIELTRASLIAEHTPGRFLWHDLLRAYATELAAQDPEPERRAALIRLLDHYTHTADTAARLLYPQRSAPSIAQPQSGISPEGLADPGQALTWFTAEHAVLMAAVDHAVANGFDFHVWQLAWALDDFLDRRGHWHDKVAVQQAAVAAAGRLADPSAQARAHRLLAVSHTRLGRFDDADAHLQHALDLTTQTGDLTGQAATHHHHAMLRDRQGRYSEGLDHARQALELYSAAGSQRGQALGLNAVGWAHARLGDHQQALIDCKQALALHEALGEHYGQASTWDSLGYAYDHLGQHSEAVTCYDHALELYVSLGHRHGEADTLSRLGDSHYSAGNPRGAQTAWQQALTVFDELEHPNADQLRTKLATLDRPPNAHLR